MESPLEYSIYGYIHMVYELSDSASPYHITLYHSISGITAMHLTEVAPVTQIRPLRSDHSDRWRPRFKRGQPLKRLSSRSSLWMERALLGLIALLMSC